jgi:multidrug efflux system membrane fusion protein
MTPPRRFRWGLIPLGLLLIALVAWIAFGHQQPKQRRFPPTPVAVAQASLQDVPVYVVALGSAQPWQGVVITPQISGRLTYVAKEGDNVAAGALLAQIDCGPYQAALTQARGALTRDQAVLQGARANLARYQALVAQNSIARQTAEDQAATVKQDEGTVLADQGTVAAAQVNVRYCQIRSPISGRVGVRLVDPGNVVSASSTTGGIVSVNQIQPIAVTFTVPQGDFQRLSAASRGFSLPLATEAYSQETGADLGVGELVVADNHVDPSTGTVQLKARFPNPERQLWPGQFVNVRLTMQSLAHALTVPSAAVNQGPKGSFVYVVGPDHKAQVRPVTISLTQGDVAVIQSGLKPGETVVTDGQMSLRPGSMVTVGGAGGPGGPGGGPPGRGRGYGKRPS